MEQKVIEVAHEVRDWAEDIAEKEGWHESLAGLCAIATAELWRRLSHRGIKAKICMCEEEAGFHAFLKHDDHIICVTATQFKKFRNEPVLIRHEKELEDEPFYRHPVYFNDSRMLRAHQLNTGWVREQIARK